LWSFEKQKTPTSAETLTGARIHTAEAVQTRQVNYRRIGCGSQGEIHGDLLPLRNNV
jgi:hypothetical protein